MSKPPRYVPWAEKPVTPLTSEQRDLAARHVNIAKKLARPLMAMFPESADEFESAALLAIVQAARDFDPTRGRFSTFAYRRVRGAMSDVSQKGDPKGYRRLASRDGIPSTCQLRFTPVSCELAVGFELDDVDAFEGLIRPLPENIRHACRRRYLHGESQCRIAKSLGVSQAEVSRRLRLAVTMLRHELIA